ncbi:hypothetical protein [Georgenia sp. Z1491]|uniref:hypothetical protein n=1 Tax=Georgenia sp. Z1491 TaxID=3416707 RepID=UPI003CEEE7C6
MTIRPPDPGDDDPTPSHDPGRSRRPLDDAEVDRRFASILDQLGVGPGDAGPDDAGPAGAGRTTGPTDPGADGDAPVGTDRLGARPAVGRGLGPRDHVVEEHPEDPEWGIDGFVEPDPPGPDLSDPGAILGWTCAIAPIVLGIVLGVLGRPPSVALMLLGLAVTVAGIVLLVRRLPGERGHGSDGAVV